MSEKIDALRQRHSELLAQIAEARDNGADELEIEMLREELANVQAMLHAIAPRRAKAPRARTVSMAAQAENGGGKALSSPLAFDFAYGQGLRNHTDGCAEAPCGA